MPMAQGVKGEVYRMDRPAYDSGEPTEALWRVWHTFLVVVLLASLLILRLVLPATRACGPG